MKYFITGISGMVGAHLARAIWSQADEVYGFVQPRSRSQVLSAAEWNRIVRLEGDVTDFDSVRSAIETVEPDRIVHLAAHSIVPYSWTAKTEVIQVNVVGTINVLEAARGLGPGPRVLVAGSSEEYGLVTPRDCPIHEDTPLNPQSPYGVSKEAADKMAYVFYRSYPKMFVVRTRAFNHFAQGRPDNFAEGSFARQVALIEAGLQEPTIKHGNLDAIRDYTDARDAVRAYLALLELGGTGQVYNVASGKGYAIREILETLVKLSTVKDIRLVEDPTRMRPSDVPLLIGDSRKLHTTTSWAPEISIQKTLSDLLDWHREQVK